MEYPGANNDALGQPLALVPRPGRQLGQLLYAGQRGGDQEVRQVTARTVGVLDDSS